MGLEEQREGMVIVFSCCWEVQQDKDFKKKILDDPQNFLVEFQDWNSDFSVKEDNKCWKDESVDEMTH